MIYTLTLNPSLDYIVNVEKLELGKVNRTISEEKFPGGKGINVSRVLTNLNVDNIALGFIGGFVGEFLDSTLNCQGVDTQFIKVQEDTRINVKLKSNKETEINASGPKITKENLDELLNKLDKLHEDDILVLAGNIQKDLPRNLYSLIQDRLKHKKVKVVVDTSGEALIESIKNKPFLIKPNNHEIEEIFDVSIKNEKDLIFYGKKLITMGAENVIISRAEKGAIFINKEKIYISNAPKGEVKNSVGAGDSLVAGFLAQYSKSKDIKQAFKMGIATGSASAFSMDLCTKEDVFKLVNEINVMTYKED